MLSSSKQARVFQPPPVGSRLCVVRSSVQDERGGSAPATPTASTAARCSSNDCPDQHPPDLCRRPVDDLVLTMKCMGIDKLRLAEKRLETLGILEKPEVKNIRIDEEEILKVTPLGKAVSAFPLLPRYGKMLALSHQQNLLAYTIALVSALTVPEVMSGKPESWPATGNILLLGDLGVLLRAVGAAEYAHIKGEEEIFCAKYGLREKAVKEIRKLRKQLTSEINLSVAGVNVAVDPEMKPPDDNQARLLRQLVLSGLGDQVGRKIGLEEVKQGEDKRKYKYAYHTGELKSPSIFTLSPSFVKPSRMEPEWLPIYVPQLCNLGDPLSDPAPRYDEKSGRVKSHFKGTFGKAGWELPIVEIDFPDKIDRYKWFARYLLEGVVFPKLKKYTSSLLSPPSTMVKSWAKLQPRTEVLLKALIAKRAGTRDALRAVWVQQSNFLLDEYLKWVRSQLTTR
ncbi:unnamed protein product [Arctia plantaginis]|uniref:Helicase-associated domain-containing protein n=1 Tax=Arctia plantaginis TaxID=874455 RepID=A0A8S1BIE8_ARCPL|nr:unnamed protein product [Arctia plantaginis]